VPAPLASKVGPYSNALPHSQLHGTSCHAIRGGKGSGCALSSACTLHMCRGQKCTARIGDGPWPIKIKGASIATSHTAHKQEHSVGAVVAWGPCWLGLQQRRRRLRPCRRHMRASSRGCRLHASSGRNMAHPHSGCCCGGGGKRDAGRQAGSRQAGRQAAGRQAGRQARPRACCCLRGSATWHVHMRMRRMLPHDSDTTTRNPLSMCTVSEAPSSQSPAKPNLLRYWSG
jgi:hypothetical protein